METTLNVSLMLDSDCSLVAYDDSNYQDIISDINKHGIVEFLKNDNLEIIKQRVHTIRDYEDPLLRVSEKLNLPSDGTFYYYRMIIPTLSHY